MASLLSFACSSPPHSGSLTQWLAAAAAPMPKSASSFGSGTPWSPYYVYSYMNSPMNPCFEYSQILICMWIHIWIHKICFHLWIQIWIHKFVIMNSYMNSDIRILWQDTSWYTLPHMFFFMNSYMNSWFFMNSYMNSLRGHFLVDRNR